MNRKDIIHLKDKLNRLQCHGEKGFRNLKSLVNEIRIVFSFIEKGLPKNCYNPLQGNISQFVESEALIEGWLRKPKKSEEQRIFREAKSDFISILDDYIKLGDTHNLWKDI